MGTLGVIVEATFKLSPVPPETGALAAVFPSLQHGMQAADELLQQVSAPQGIQVIDWSAARHTPSTTAISGGIEAAADPRGALVLAFFSGRNQALRRRMDDAITVLNEQGALDITSLQRSESAELLETLTGLGWSPDSLPYLSLKLSLPPSAVGKLINLMSGPAMAPEAQHLIELEPLVLGVAADPGFGLVRLLWWTDDREPPSDDRVISAISRVREMSRQLGGSTVVEHCPLSVKRGIDVWGEATETIEIMRRIKDKFDPARVLNPGRFVGGI